MSEKEGEGGVEVEMVASIACYGRGCEHVYGRLFQRGDYVRKIVGRCPRCGGELYVRAIYAVEEKRKS
nr:hypothetical protein [Candidatus Njordarchaeum guaymaensis]